MRSEARRRDRHLRLAVYAVCACALSCAPTSKGPKQTVSWAPVERVIAFADVHGAYDELAKLLRVANVVDADLRWSAGQAHVVSLGDLLDRGAGSRKTMDLMMRLQEQAVAAGGALHVLLGNHEAMNLMGDLHDTTAAELSEYGGYSGHRAAFASDGKYGRWLLGLPVAIVIGDTLFMHGGPSRLLSGEPVGELNGRYRSALSAYLTASGALLSSGLLKEDDPFANRAALAQKRLSETAIGSLNIQHAREESVRRFVAADADPMLESDGPNWYRGAALCHEASESDVLKPLLDGLRVKRLVIGHTVTRSRRVSSRFDGAVIKLDTGMNRAVFHGQPAALLLEGGVARAVYAEGGPPAGIPAEPLYVGSNVPDETAASVLAGGRVTVGETRSPGTLDVMVELEGLRIPAVFIEANGAAVRKEVAAYRLDRALRLGLVPATVEREIQGRQGILQARPARWVTQAEVEDKSLRPEGWCPLPPQLALMDVFDALIGNEARTRERILYDASEWMLLLTGHEQAFGASASFPRNLQARPPDSGPELRRRLAALDAPALARILGNLLTEDERIALSSRRDGLLAVR